MRKEKRILIMGHSLIIPSNRRLWQELAQLPATEVSLICPKNWHSNLLSDLNFMFKNSIDRNFSQVIPLPVYYSGRGSFYFFHFFKLLKILYSKKYDYILMTQESWSWSFWQLCLLKLLTRNAKTCLFLHINQNIKKEKLYFLTHLERFFSFFVTAYLGCCYETEEVLRWKNIKRPWAYLPFSYDSKTYGVVSKNKKSKIKGEAPGARIKVGFMGRLCHEKGVDRLRDIFNILYKEGLNIELIIAGKGPLKKLFINQKNIIYKGPIPHHLAHTFYEQIDFFVLPSQTTGFWKEQFGRVIVECAASLRPIIASDSGAIPEVMATLKCPYLFRENSREDFLKVLGQAIVDKDTEQLKAQLIVSQKICEREFSHKSVALKIYDIFENKGPYT